MSFGIRAIAQFCSMVALVGCLAERVGDRHPDRERVPVHLTIEARFIETRGSLSKVEIIGRLRNILGSPIRICTWPGLRGTLSGMLADGVVLGQTEAKGRGASVSCFTNDFILLRPGEEYLCSTLLDLPKELEVTGKMLEVGAEYESMYDGHDLGLNAWAGKVSAQTVILIIPAEDRYPPTKVEGSCHPPGP